MKFTKDDANEFELSQLKKKTQHFEKTLKTINALYEVQQGLF